MLDCSSAHVSTTGIRRLRRARFFSIEGAEKTFREVNQLYARFRTGDRIAMTEGYHGPRYYGSQPGSGIRVPDGSFQSNAGGDKEPWPPFSNSRESSCNAPRLGQVMQEIFKTQNRLDTTSFGVTITPSTKGGPGRNQLRRLFFGKGYPGIRSWKLVHFDNVAPSAGTIAWENAGNSTFQT